MKINIHKSNERGTSRYDWLLSRHSFSFANYYNPKKMNFGALRVLNDDIVDAGKGFGMHRHENMEIVSIVLEGSLEHKDSMGNHGIIKENEVQRMSAGTGVNHSEFNHSKTDKSHFLQIWIEPNEMGLEPSYEQKNIPTTKNKLHEVASGTKKKDVVYIHQNTFMFIGNFDKGNESMQILADNSHGAFVFVIEGEIELEKNILAAGDSAEITGAGKVAFKANKQSKVLLIEVPMN